VEKSDSNPSDDQQPPILDEATALETAADDPELVDLLRTTCLQEAPKIIAQARQAVTDSDWKTARRSGHSLRSSFRAIGALAASEESGQLEEVELDNPEDFIAAIEVIETAMQKLLDHLGA
jgi:HPt (histidine-containing phosphotransfer) domain-containing protein